MKTFSKIIKLNKDDTYISKVKVLDMVESVLDTRFNCTVYGNTGQFKGDVKTAFLTPVVTMHGNIQLDKSDETNSIKIAFTVDEKPNFWFWLFCLIGVFIPLLYGVLIFLHFSQKRTGYDEFEQVLIELENKVGTF